MARRAATRESIKRNTIKDMKNLGVYKPEFNRLIEIYSELIEQYELLQTRFIESNYSYETETMQGGAKKSPLVGTLESLRKDILAYSDRLCLNPKSLEKGNDNSRTKKESTLVQALKKFG